MSRVSVLNQLLLQDETLHPNTLLLKKYLLCIHNGWFRINGCPPDENHSLGDYLFDDERVIFDFTRLSPQSREDFFNWFILPHSDDAFRAPLSGVATNDYRGYTAEVGLSWWGRITNQLFYKKKSYQWSLSPLELSLNYQLNGIEMCEGENGLLIGLKQLATEDNGDKYHEPFDNQEKPLRNTKRLHLTDDLVKKLLLMNIQSQHFQEIAANPHPYSIHVANHHKRYEQMHEYRHTQRFLAIQPWYKRLWRWVKSWFVQPLNDIEMEEVILKEDKQFKPLIEEDDVSVSYRAKTGEILIKEKRPDLDSMVFCGGGAKIFAHVGAYQAFEEAGIKPTKFAGSSAGGIMATLCYLGYSSKEIFEFFKGFRQDILVHYDIDRSGISDTTAMKAALDFMIVKKVNQIIKKYNIDGTAQGKRFLANNVFHDQKISFESLHALKMKYPHCGIGDDLIITATNVIQQKTRYFSFSKTPKMEVSLAGTLSASLPVLFKSTIFEGEVYNDGGILSNLPTEAIRDNFSTFLESEHGNCLSLVVFQFDTGYERGILDKVLPKGVYRENFLLNWFYSLITGVNDPASGWERDRLKLLQHSNQVVLLPVENVSSTQFDLEPETQTRLVANGYEPAVNYINARYVRSAENGTAENDENMSMIFTNIQEALYYCCYRKREDWFDKLSQTVPAQGIEKNKIAALKAQHFGEEDIPETVDEKETRPSGFSLFKTQLLALFNRNNLYSSIRLFEALYPVFIKIPDEFVSNPQDLKLFKAARHAITLNAPLRCLHYLEQMNGDVHVLLRVLIKLLSDYKLRKFDVEPICSRLNQFHSLLVSQSRPIHPHLFGQWDFLDRHVNRIFDDWERGQWLAITKLCEALNENEEPLQTIIKKSELKKENLSNDSADYWCMEQEGGLVH